MCRKNTENKNPKVVRTKSERIMHLSRCELCDGKKSKFIKEQESIVKQFRNRDTFK